jgi:hypothetical protein
MMAPKEALHHGETGLLLAKGEEKMLLKANTFQVLCCIESSSSTVEGAAESEHLPGTVLYRE